MTVDSSETVTVDGAETATVRIGKVMDNGIGRFGTAAKYSEPLTVMVDGPKR